MTDTKTVVNGCFVVFVFVFRTSDSIGDLIGKGASGRVYSAVKGEKRFAIKMVPYETKDEIEFADNEERTFKLLSGLCPYLVRIEDSFEDVLFYFIFFVSFLFFYFKKRGFKYFVMKLRKSSLKDFIESLSKFNLTISEDRVWKIVSQFFIALAVLNSKNMAHRDVNDGNIFIDEDDNIVVGVVSSFIDKMYG
jgi:serine/threonine protein kinase